MAHKFEEYDHIIWDNDTHREVCVLIRCDSSESGFKDDQFGEYLNNSQLDHARKATQKEIYDYWQERVDEH